VCVWLGGGNFSTYANWWVDLTAKFKYFSCHVCVIRIFNVMCMIRMGWLRLVGSLKLQVSFAKEPYKRDDILQKRPMILRSLPIVATP